MKKESSALNFSEKERICESIFINNGPYWHVYTDGTRMQNIFCCEKDFITGMWALAASPHLSKKARALQLQRLQPAASKDAANGPGNPGRDVSVNYCNK